MKKVVGFMVLAVMVASFASVSCKAGEDGDTVYIPYTPETKDNENENKAAETAHVPQIKTQPQGASYTVGSKNVNPLRVIAEVTDGGTLSYQWYKTDGSPINGATSATFQPFDDGKAPFVETETIYSYYCIVTNTYENATDTTHKTQTKQTSTAVITVKPLPKPVAPAIPDGKNLSGTAAGESKVSLSIEASVTDEGSISYQWYKDGAEISGATNPSYEAVESGKYYVEVINSLRGLATKIKSNECTVTIGGGNSSGDAGINIDFN